jgi:hypothetical protein
MAEVTTSRDIISYFPTGGVGKSMVASKLAFSDTHTATRNVYQNFLFDYGVHKDIVSASSAAPETVSMVYYLRATRPAWVPAESSSSVNLTAEARRYYQNVEERLEELGTPTSGQPELIEKGAVTTALAVVRHLKERELAPPELSWHGGDAVVMLWALGSTTYAITVTDGELGYVVRQNKKSIRMADSISIDSFKLEDLR